MKTPHTTVYRGKKVLIKLRNGKTFIAKFYDKQGSRIHFFDHEEIRAGDVVSLKIFKGIVHQHDSV